MFPQMFIMKQIVLSKRSRGRLSPRIPSSLTFWTQFAEWFCKVVVCCGCDRVGRGVLEVSSSFCVGGFFSRLVWTTLAFCGANHFRKNHETLANQAH